MKDRGSKYWSFLHNERKDPEISLYKLNSLAFEIIVIFSQKMLQTFCLGLFSTYNFPISSIVNVIISSPGLSPSN